MVPLFQWFVPVHQILFSPSLLMENPTFDGHSPHVLLSQPAFGSCLGDLYTPAPHTWPRPENQNRHGNGTKARFARYTPFFLVGGTNFDSNSNIVIIVIIVITILGVIAEFILGFIGFEVDILCNHPMPRFIMT